MEPFKVMLRSRGYLPGCVAVTGLNKPWNGHLEVASLNRTRLKCRLSTKYKMQFLQTNF